MLPDMPVSFQSQPRCQAPGDTITFLYKSNVCWFQSQPRCQAPGDEYKGFVTVAFAVFQSQPRCQAPGDLPYLTLLYHRDNVSISTEMPGPWRLHSGIRCPTYQRSFNLNRDARPLAT